jgi:hypothetical protein
MEGALPTWSKVEMDCSLYRYKETLLHLGTDADSLVKTLQGYRSIKHQPSNIMQSMSDGDKETVIKKQSQNIAYATALFLNRCCNLHALAKDYSVMLSQDIDKPSKYQGQSTIQDLQGSLETMSAICPCVKCQDTISVEAYAHLSHAANKRLLGIVHQANTAWSDLKSALTDEERVDLIEGYCWDETSTVIFHSPSQSEMTQINVVEGKVTIVEDKLAFPFIIVADLKEEPSQDQE